MIHNISKIRKAISDGYNKAMDAKLSAEELEAREEETKRRTAYKDSTTYLVKSSNPHKNTAFNAVRPERVQGVYMNRATRRHYNKTGELVQR